MYECEANFAPSAEPGKHIFSVVTSMRANLGPLNFKYRGDTHSRAHWTDILAVVFMEGKPMLLAVFRASYDQIILTNANTVLAVGRKRIVNFEPSIAIALKLDFTGGGVDQVQLGDFLLGELPAIGQCNQLAVLFQ